MVATVTPDELDKLMHEQDIVLFDVREPFERAVEHVGGSRSAPLSRFDAGAVKGEAGGVGDDAIIFHCRSGHRSAEAVAQLRRWAKS